MIPVKQIGIWMDHSVAHLMEPEHDFMICSITSEFTREEKELSLTKNEFLMHNKERQQQSKYYNTIKDAIKDYDDVLIFGPTDAKNELVNVLKNDHHFDKVRIGVEPADKMTENQQQAFVKEYFQKVIK